MPYDENLAYDLSLFEPTSKKKENTSSGKKPEKKQTEVIKIDELTSYIEKRLKF